MQYEATTRASSALVLVDDVGRYVVVASRRQAARRAWRRWAVLIGANGAIEDCFYEDHATSDELGAPVVTSLLGDGYRVASKQLARAQELVKAGVARAVAAMNGNGPALARAYYLGRDLLELGDTHAPAPSASPSATAAHKLDRAHELLAAGDHAGADAVLARCAAPAADLAAARAAACLQRGDAAAALPLLQLAIDGDPQWPLHHWNLGCAHHALGDRVATYHALRRFVTTSAQPTGLYADPDQPARVVFAERMLAELERAARLDGAPLETATLARARRRRRSRRAR